MRLSSLRFATAGLLAVAIACGPLSSARVRGPSTPGTMEPRPGTSPSDLGGWPADPPRTPTVGGLPGPATGTRNAAERRVCRTSAVPRGWIAVAYVSGDGQCPARRGADSEATAAVLMRYADLSLGTVLEVCADQPLPEGWLVAREQVSDADRCPGAVRDDGPTTKRIERRR